ncbi:MAG: hypothetical protein WBH47_08560, partial [Streptosporangiaceae bacterium]
VPENRSDYLQELLLLLLCHRRLHYPLPRLVPTLEAMPDVPQCRDTGHLYPDIVSACRRGRTRDRRSQLFPQAGGGPDKNDCYIGTEPLFAAGGFTARRRRLHRLR